MIDLYLCAETKTQMDGALARAGVMDRFQVNAIDENGEQSERFEYAPKAGIDIDVIGEIPDASGWHVNLRADLTDEQIAALAAVTIIPPATPYRVWA